MKQRFANSHTCNMSEHPMWNSVEPGTFSALVGESLRFLPPPGVGSLIPRCCSLWFLMTASPPPAACVGCSHACLKREDDATSCKLAADFPRGVVTEDPGLTARSSTRGQRHSG
ncbi:unnamed protein product [Pleuronectes platessa]|uniref:Uncharacterized protein n=1 Tax=Pleuronectes platessa TaxID=8262 RepID=A0A9N7TIE0_PLEPL|nr:unnamed protein product [Pleuronectes platessa]